MRSRMLGTTRKDIDGGLRAYVGKCHRKEFARVRVDTCCNKRSVMSLALYTAYCTEFGLKGAIIPQVKPVLQGISGKPVRNGTGRIQVPFA